MHIDLDYVYDENLQQMDRNIDVLIQRVKDMQISTVYLQAFADPDGDGLVKEWICPYISRHLLSLNPLQARCRRYSRGER